MGIIDDYFKTSTEYKPADTSSKPSSIINQYMSENNDRPKVIIQTPKPPISDATPEQSATINAQPGIQGGANPREGISSVPLNAIGATYDAAKSGVMTAGSGIGDIFNKQPATGSSKIGLGLLSALTSPIAGVQSVVGDLTGSKDIADRAGFVAGALPVSRLAKLGADYLPLRMPTPSNLNPITSPPIAKDKALSSLVSAITSEGRNPGKLTDTVNAMKADSRIGPTDTSPNVLAIVQDMYAKDNPAAKSYLFDASKGRVSNLKNDTSAAFNEAGGIPVNVLQKLADLKVGAEKVGSEMINPALAAAKPVNISNTVSEIDNILKPGVWSKFEKGDSTLPLSNIKSELSTVRDYLANKKEIRTDPQDLHEFQSTLRRTADNMLNSGNASERSLGKHLMDVRNNLVNDIHASAPGYKEGLAAYRGSKELDEAFHDGYYGVFSNSTKMENRPEFTKDWFDNLTAHEKEAAKEGIRLAIDSRMGAAQNSSLAGTNLGRSDFNQQKMEIVFGKEETEKLLRNLENTRSIKHVDNKITEGSDTAVRMSNKKDTALSKDEPAEQSGVARYIVPAIGAASEIGGQFAGLGGGAGGIIGTGLSLAGLAAGKGTSVIKSKIINALEQERNLQLAKYSLPTQGPDRDQLIKTLETIANKQQTPRLSNRSKLRLMVGP